MMLRVIIDILRSRRAATAVEYGLIMSLVFLALVVGVRALGTSTTAVWSDLGNVVANAR